MPSTLSAIICNRNHAQYLPGALRAVLEQSTPPDEVIVVDDASGDNSVEVITRLARRYSRIRLLKNETGMGAIYSANRGLKRSTGEYVYCGAADDRILPGFFEKSTRLLGRHPQAGLCFTDPAYFDEGGGRLRAGRLRLAGGEGYLERHEFCERIRTRRVGIAGHTTVIRRAALEQAGWYLPELRWHCDWFVVLLLAFRFGACYVPEPLAAMMLRADSYSASGMRNRREERMVLRTLLRLLVSPTHADVAGDFRRSGVLASSGALIVPVLLESREFAKFLNLSLLRWLLWGYSVNAAVSVTPRWLRLLYERLRDEWRNRGQGASWRVPPSAQF